MRWRGLSCVLIMLLGAGCAREEPPAGDPWSRVTGVPGEALGFEDQWEVTAGGNVGVKVSAHIRSAELARIDFDLENGDYAVLFNHGRTVRLMPEGPTEVDADRTLLLTYMLPFLGPDRLQAALDFFGVDTSRITHDHEWGGVQCMVIGLPPADSTAGDPVPAIFFDQKSGAVLRLITVDLSPIGVRVGDFRLFDHEERMGAQLPTRFETWAGGKLRSCLEQVSATHGAPQDVALFGIPSRPALQR